MCNMIPIFNKIVDGRFESVLIINIWSKKIIPNILICYSPPLDILRYTVSRNFGFASQFLNFGVVLFT